MNSSVFSCRLSAIYDDDVLTESGKEFHARAAATGNARSPSVIGMLPRPPPRMVNSAVRALPHGNALMIGTREVAIPAAAVLCLLIRSVPTVVRSVAESVQRDAAVVTSTALITGRTRMAGTISPCIVNGILRLTLTKT